MAITIKMAIKRLKYIRQYTSLNPICKYPPESIYIEPTNICNLRCRMCPHSGEINRKQGFMKWELYTKIISDLEEYREKPYINLYCHGESLLHDRLINMINYAKERGFRVGLNTNSVLLDEKKTDEILKTDLDWIYFSFDGINVEIYEKIRVGAKFEEVKQNILNFIKKRKSNKPRISIEIIKNELTRNHLKDFIEFWRNKVEIVRVEELLNMHNKVLKDEELNWWYELQNKKITKHHPPCMAPWTASIINWDGKVQHCLTDFETNIPLGDVNEEKFTDIWNNIEYQDIRMRIRDHNPKKGMMCSLCSLCWYAKNAIPFTFKGLFFISLMSFYYKILKGKKFIGSDYKQKIREHFYWDHIKYKWKFKF